MSKSGKKKQDNSIATNRKAFRDYYILDTYEAGMRLTGTEVKSLRLQKANLNDSHARVHGGEVYLYGCHINPYEQGNQFNHDPLRTRKLLMHRSEIKRLIGMVEQKRYALIPLRLYFKKGWVKVEIALCKGKTEYDKREAIKRKTADREAEVAIKEHHRKTSK